MDALTPIILHTQLEGKKTAVSTLTQGDQVVLADGSTLPQTLARVLAAAVESAAARIVPDIPARDTLPDKYAGLQVWVRDATADPTVQRGAAKYLWDAAANEGAGSWLKVAESESMDVVVLWEAVQGIPQVLNYLDISSQGLLTFNGETVYDRRREVAVVDSAAPVPLDMREGALVLERAVGGDDVVPKVVQGGVPITIVPSLRGPQGQPGRDGVDGGAGAQGLAATITVGTVTTGAPGSAAAVTNAGSAQAAVLDFAIPQGPQGPQGMQGTQGDTGAQGIQGVPGLQGLPGVPGLAGATPPLNDTITSSSTTEAATANAVRVAYDKGAEGVNAAVAARQVADGKAPGGFGLGTTSPAITDCDHALRNGWYAGSHLLNAPTVGWYIIFVAEHCHTDNWRYQLAFGYAGAAGMWWRQCNGGTWTGWRQLDGDAAVSASPAYTHAAIAAYTNYVVPGYIVGSRRLQVWLDGILCECGGNAAQHQYQEVGTAGTWSNVIQFHDSIDVSFDISARVR